MIPFEVIKGQIIHLAIWKLSSTISSITSWQHLHA